MPLLEGNLVDLVSNADPARALLLSIKQSLPPELSKALSLIASIDDHYGKVKRAKHNLSIRSALLSEKNENASQAKRLHSSFKTMQVTVGKLQPELIAIEIEKADLEKKLADLCSKIDSHKAQLADLPNSIDTTKKELSAKYEEYQNIKIKLERIPGTEEDDKHQLAEVESIRTNALGAIK